MEPDAVELRVLGCLLEKQRTTPDAYPLSLNALRAACNQTTNRDPVVALGEGEVREALNRLGRRRWTRLASGPGSRAPKFRHLADEALGLGDAELSVLAVLLLRGPQTLGELRARTERLHPLASTDEVAAVLQALAERGFAERVRRPGWKEERWTQRLGGEADETAAAGAPATAPAEPTARLAGGPGRDERLEALEHDVADLRAQLLALRDQLGA